MEHAGMMQMLMETPKLVAGRASCPRCLVCYAHPTRSLCVCVLAGHLLQEPNIRYLALENLTRLALVPEVLESIREHQVGSM